MSMIRAVRYHDISCGHRVVGHESKCAALHGHNYRIHFKCEAAELDAVGRVIDFSVMKGLLCNWLEENWDHRFLIWDQDPLLEPLRRLKRTSVEVDRALVGLIAVPFNPTAENMAVHLLEVIGPRQLAGTDVRLCGVDVEETRKCSVEVHS